MPRCRSPRPARIPAARREVSCPGRGAAYFTLLRRAGTHRYERYAWAPDQQRTACALRGIRGTIPRRLQRRHPMTPAPVIRLHPDDGVLIARSSLPPGMVVAEGVTTVERIPAGHKVAIRPIATGEPIRRYGQIIGFATSPIAPGQHVHTQNCGMGDFPNVDGVVALTHKTGCGMTQDEPLTILRRTLGGYARHVNFSAVVVLGLGCEVNQIGGLMQEQKLAGRLRAMDIQEVGGTRKTVEAGVAFVREALTDANKVKREPVPASELTVALQCGGSDGYSGVSANPALGAASDLLVRHGGTVILSETPETYGAEHLLTRRAVSREVGEKLVALMRWWEAYTEREGAEMNANPSPGNKAGGLTTILEKSLGAMAKAGSTNLVDVVNYAEAVTKNGFVFMDTPGYDPVAATGQVAGGANLVCFTTGRGSVFGCKPAPSIKLATNSPMFKRMEDDMDVNCGTILDGEETVQQCGQRIFDLMLKTASGQPTKSESFDFGGAEFAPWVLGATM